MVYKELRSNSVSSSPVVPSHTAIRDIGKISETNFKQLVVCLTNSRVQDLTSQLDNSSDGQKKFLALMEPEESLTCLQNPATGPYPEPVKSNSHLHSHFSKNNFNIIFICMPRSPN